MNLPVINQIKTARVIFVSAILFILLLAILSYSRLNALVDSGELVNHTTQVTLELERTIGCLKDAETGHRGFLITHDTRFLEPYNKGLNEYPEHLKTLQQLTKDNPVQERNLLSLDNLSRHRQEYMRKILEEDKMHASTAAEMLIGKAIMDSLRTQVNKMIKVEEDLIEQRRQRLQKQTFLAPAMIFILGISALVILLIAYRQINRSLLTSQQLRNEVIKQNIEIEKNKELQSIFEQAPVSMTLLQVPGFVVKVVNETALNLWGKKYEEVINRPFFEISPELEEVTRPVFDNILKTGNAYRNNEIRLEFNRNGKPYIGYFAILRQPVRNEQGKITSIVSITSEVTESVLAKNKVEDSEKRYNLMLMKSPFAFAIQKGDDMVVTMANDAMKLIWGKGNEVEGKAFLEFLPELKDQPFLKLLQDVSKSGIAYYGYEMPARLYRNGKMEDAYFNFVYQPHYEADGTISGTTTIAYDATIEATAKKQIEESEKQYRELADTLPQLVWKTDAAGDQTYASSRWEEYTGLDLKNKDTFQKILHPDDLKGITQAWTVSLSTGNTYKHQVRLKNKEGNYRWFYVHGEPVKNHKGEIESWIGAFTDINEQKIAEATLIESKEQFNAMADNIPNLSWMARADGWIYWYNKKWYEYTGTIPEQMEGWGWQSVHDPEYLPDVMKSWQRSIESGQPFEMVFPIKGSDGLYRPFLTRVLPVKGKEGKIEQWFGTNTDITALKKFEAELRESEMRYRELSLSLEQKVSERTFDLKKSEEKFNNLFQFSPLGIVLAEIPSGRLINVNESYANLLGFSIDEMIGKSNQEMGIINAERREELTKVLTENGYLKGTELLLRGKSGKIIPVLASSQIVDIGNEKYFLSAITDITERKKAEEEIAQNNRDLVKMNEELTSFAYISSHDLQEPLRKIQMFSKRLAEKEAAALSDNGKDLFNRMINAAQRMQQLINDLLSYSKANNADRKLENTDLNKILDEVKEDLKEDIEDKHATIESSRMCEARIIPFQFRQLMHNLIGNALKFSNPSRPPHIKISSEITMGTQLDQEKLLPQANYCHISISDNGIGFDPQYREQIFGIFQRLHNRSDYDGTGIGLSIVKKIVENHEGIITAAGIPGEGATFEIYIPAT